MRIAVTAIGLSCLATAACMGGSMPPGDDGAPVNCAAETRDDDFAIGLEKLGAAGVLDFTLMSAEPAPPVRGDNTWVIQVTSISGGAPAANASMTVTPYMPDHGHPSGKTVNVEAMPDAGQYKLTPLNFWMPGLWETTLDVTSGGGNDTVVLRFCIPS
jgi:YtkA-like